MTAINKIIFGLIAVVIAITAIGGYYYPKSVISIKGVSSVGVTNGDAKISTITMAPATGATTTTILNNGGSDRAVTSSLAYCTGVGTSLTPLTGTGLASWQLQIATTSTAGATVQGNTNYVASFVIGTSTPFTYAATTSPYAGGVTPLWPVNTYLTFAFNATNTAACTVGVYYVSL